MAQDLPAIVKIRKPKLVGSMDIPAQKRPSSRICPCFIFIRKQIFFGLSQPHWHAGYPMNP